jgi:Protein of unknown function (DUF4230)
MTTRPIDDTVVDDSGYQRTAVEPDGPTGGRWLRRLLMLGGTIGLIVALVFGLKAVDLWPTLRNPFATQKTDRSGPVLLKSIQDMSRYVAAEGNFQVLVDLQQNKKFIPDILVNERTLFVGAGSVDAYVDFGSIGEGAIVESADGKSVQIKLPAPVLEKPSIDVDHSYVFAEERGLVNRVGDLFGGDPNRQQQLYQLAEQKITQAAEDSELRQRAENNTRAMLTSMLKSLGYQNVTITFAQP